MKFLDLNGLKYLLKFIDRTVSVTTSKCTLNPKNNRVIPFITNHQIINLDETGFPINTFDWFQKASKGGILEVFSIGGQGASINCYKQSGSNYLYKMQISQSGPCLDRISSLTMSYNSYIRLIKVDDNKLVVAEFVENK